MTIVLAAASLISLLIVEPAVIVGMCVVLLGAATVFLLMGAWQSLIAGSLNVVSGAVTLLPVLMQKESDTAFVAFMGYAALALFVASGVFAFAAVLSEKQPENDGRVVWGEVRKFLPQDPFWGLLVAGYGLIVVTLWIPAFVLSGEWSKLG